MNTTVHPAPDAPEHGFRRWFALSVILGLSVIALLSWLHFEQRRSLQQASRQLGELRQAQVHLAKGFLQFSLGGDPQTPFNRAEGIVLLRQSVLSFERSLSRLESLSAEETETFRQTAESFLKQLENWRDAPAGDLATPVRLRIAFSALERKAGKLDALAQAAINKLRADNDRHYLLSLAGSLLALSLITGIVLNAVRKERLASRQGATFREAHRSSETRFRRLFDDTPVAMALADQNGRIIAQNKCHERLFGFTLNDTPSLDDWWLQAYPDPAYRTAVTARWQAAVDLARQRNGDIEAGEYRVTCKDGSERMVQIFGILLADGMLSTFLDVTDNRLAENRLRLWAEAFEQAQLGLAISDARSNAFIAVNPAFARERGYTPEELTGKPIGTVFPEDRQPEIRQYLASIDHSTHGVLETEHRRRDGSRFPVLLDITVLKDADGQAINRVAYALDITERKRAEQALAAAQSAALTQQKQARIATLNQMQDANAARERAEKALAALHESRERLALFIEHAPAALAMFDREMRYIAVSRRWLADYALTGHDIIGKSHYAILPEITEEWKAVHRRGLAGEVVRADAERFRRADGSVQWIRWEVHPWHEADGPVGGIVIFSEDISRQKQAEEDIRQLNADLERRVLERTSELSAANAELESFAYAVSHDLRAPLRAMSGFSQAMVEDYGNELSDEARGYLDQIVIASRRMGDLIDGILTLSRSTRGELLRNPVDISSMATRKLQTLAGETPERQGQWQVEPGLDVAGDERMIEVVIDNLLDNAWKYSSRVASPVIQVYSETREGKRWICVSDNGAGFDMAHAERLFKPFQRLHRQDEFPGIGIGLATVQRIIHRHGGEIESRGQPGQGATFRFTLPATLQNTGN